MDIAKGIKDKERSGVATVILIENSVSQSSQKFSKLLVNLPTSIDLVCAITVCNFFTTQLNNSSL
jgi:hypothetical protein